MDSVKTDAKWKLVPELPTREMFIAAFDALVPAADAAACWGAMLAASPQPPAGAEVAARVKPLVWSAENGLCFGPSYKAVGGHVGYRIYDHLREDDRRYEVVTLGISSNRERLCHAATLEAVKAAAQDDYERRILSAIEPTPSTDAVRRQAREEAAKWAGRHLRLIADSSEERCSGIYPDDLREIADALLREARLSTPPAGADEGGKNGG